MSVVEGSQIPDPVSASKNELQLDERVQGIEYMPFVTKTTAYTAVVDDAGCCILGDTSGAGFTITLPGARRAKGLLFVFKNISTNTLTLDGAGAETIDGAATKTLTTQYEVARLRSDGTQWWTV